jgi:hypothetical protein
MEKDMCIAIYKPAGVQISKAVLKNCWNNNPDGAGFMFARKGLLHVHKGFMHFKDFWKAFNDASGNKASKANMVIHFRITSHGATNRANTHPHIINENLAFVHNGIIDAVDVPPKGRKSDTVIFNETILRKLPADFLGCDGITEMITLLVGYSRLIFLDNFGEATIINDQLGEYDLGCWFSNTSYRPDKKKKHAGFTQADDYWDNFWQFNDFESGRDENLAELYPQCELCGELLTLSEQREMEKLDFAEGYCEKCLKAMEVIF